MTQVREFPQLIEDIEFEFNSYKAHNSILYSEVKKLQAENAKLRERITELEKTLRLSKWDILAQHFVESAYRRSRKPSGE